MYKYDVFFVCINLFELSGCLCSCHRKSAAKNEVIRSDDFKMERVFRILKPDTGSRPKNLIKKPNQMPHHRTHFIHRSKTTLFDLWSSHFCIVLNITAGGHPVSSSTCTSLRAASGMTSAGVRNDSTWRKGSLHGSAGRLLLKCFYLSI